MKLIVGLGNPGVDYVNTKHNLGFQVVELLSKKWQTNWQQGKGLYLISRKTIDKKIICMVKPLTYMNQSGRVVVELVEYYSLPISHLLVICDDFNLPLGKLRLRRRGSDGGHNGLASIIYHLQSNAFSRLRIGIGRPPPNISLSDYVLSEFTKEEKKFIAYTLQLAVDAVCMVIEQGMERAMTEFNRLPPLYVQRDS